MMYISQRLLVSLVFGWAVLRSAEGRPSTSAAVELSTCGDVSAVSHSVVEECISTCQPILDAQNCSRNAACTCTIARPVAVQACLQCQLDASSSAVPNVLARIVPAKLYGAYSSSPPRFCLSSHIREQNTRSSAERTSQRRLCSGGTAARRRRATRHCRAGSSSPAHVSTACRTSRPRLLLSSRAADAHGRLSPWPSSWCSSCPNVASISER
ncbi:hypothetical protein C8Q72DRAFT_337052 [Fomitopsis betulina]|nr:hypothetical protein C8Q72DRAFT_337052 [Fomitopsis betulina]